MSDFRIAFIGTGIMGRPMCLNLLAAGFKLTVHSRTKSKAEDILKAGAVWADSPAAAAKNADVVITCVTDTPEAKEILLGKSGVIESARPGLICIDMSTISPFETQQMAKTLAENGIILIDAPVSGGQIGAEQGKLSIMAGGDKETVEKLKPVFEAMGKNVTYCGASGFGQITKLANQVMAIHTIMSVAEGLAFADSAGLDLNTTLAATSAGAAGSNSLKALGPKIIAGDFAPAFMVDLQLKDLKLVLEYAEKINQSLPGVALVKELLNVLKTQGRGRDGTQALYEVIKQLSGKKSKERGKNLSKSSFAVTEQNSKGRNYPEPEHAYRTAFERDRDRIVHCSAFRRLEGKTQVFTPHINDHYRTRATHSVEVSQIGRTIAKALGLNEALTEAACLAHDLGHGPFGHSGEVALNCIMKNFGGFEHNAQALRIVDLIERPYPDFIGLNLMYETRLALAKHRSIYDNPKISDFAEKNCSLEGQVCDIADRIAYNCHDLEDGLRAKLLNYEMITQLDICKEATEKCRADKIGDGFIRNTRIAKTIIDILVGDCIDISRTAIEINNLSDLQRVYDADSYIISLSVDAEEVLSELERFLHKNMYEHNVVKSVSIQVGGWLEKVFKKFLKNPQLMPKFYQGLIGEFGLERTVCDYISGMTDWYCLSMIEN